jgi:acyl carrier protein
MTTTTTTLDAQAQIRNVLRTHGRLNRNVDDVQPTDDLYQCGLTSHASVNVMLALEAAFDVEFPDRMLKRSVFGSIESIGQAVAELQAG